MADNAPVATASTATDGSSHGTDRVHAHATAHMATDALAANRQHAERLR